MIEISPVFVADERFITQTNNTVLSLTLVVLWVCVWVWVDLCTFRFLNCDETFDDDVLTPFWGQITSKQAHLSDFFLCYIFCLVRWLIKAINGSAYSQCLRGFPVVTPVFSHSLKTSTYCRLEALNCSRGVSVWLWMTCVTWWNDDLGVFLPVPRESKHHIESPAHCMS